MPSSSAAPSPVRSLLRGLVAAPVRALAPNGLKEATLLALARVLGVAHRTNASGNNMSQR